MSTEKQENCKSKKSLNRTPADPVELRKKKARRKRAAGALFLAAIVVLVIVLQNLNRGVVRNTQSVAVNEEVVQGSADSQTITKTLSSNGVVSSVDAKEVSVAGSIKINSWLVSDGDNVEAGDAIAIADKNSVIAAIGNVQDMMTRLDEEMMEAKDSAESTDVTATSDATVVKIYAAEDDSVVDVMYDNSALMLLSLDDLLALKIDNPGTMNVGDEVVVADSDGNSGTGKVAAIEKEQITITVDLDSFDFEEQVEVRDESGESLGNGQLSIYSQQKITGYSGIVEDVAVSEGESVEAGDTLLTLSDTDYTAVYETLLDKRVKLENQYNELVEIANTGYVYAQDGGTVSDLDKSLLVETSATSSFEKTVSNAQLVLVSEESVSDEAAVVQSEGTTEEPSQKETSEEQPSEEGTPGENPGQSGGTEGGGAEGEGESGSGSESGGETTPAETISKSINIVWKTAAGSVTTEGLPEKVTLELLQNGNVVSAQDVTADVNWSCTWSNLAKYDANGEEYSYSINAVTPDGYSVQYETVNNVMVISYTQSDSGQPGDGQTPEDGQQTPGENSGAAQTGGTPDISESGFDMSSISGSGFDMSSLSGMDTSSMSFDASSLTGSADTSLGMSASDITGADASVVTEEDTKYVMDETDLYTITSNTQVSVEISVDELDIGDVYVGQPCEVTFDAFSGTFEGVVQERKPTGSNDGGDTKYTVQIVLDKTEDMLLGMNASVNIAIEEDDASVVVPEAALLEEDGKVYVYTGYDEKKDELTDPVEVTTGASDGENVEITEGLEQGQSYYYRYADTIRYSF